MIATKLKKNGIKYKILTKRNYSHLCDIIRPNKDGSILSCTWEREDFYNENNFLYI